MKKGFLGTEIADFISILAFIVFVVVMLILFRLKGAGASAEIKSSSERMSAMTDLLNILHTKVSYKGLNLSIEKLIMYSDKNALISNLSYLYETLNLTNPEMTAFDDKGKQIFLIRRGFYDWGSSGISSNYEWQICTPESAEVFLPYHNSYIEVIFRECLK